MDAFGEKLRALMKERGISQRKLAKLVPCDDGYLSKVANGHRHPSADMAAKLDELLAADGALASLCVALDGPLGGDDCDRVTHAITRSARVDAETIDALATVLAGQRRLEDAIGAAALLVPVNTQLSTLNGMLRDAPSPHHVALGRVVAEWTTFAGWLHAARRQYTRALSLFGRAVELADEFDHGTVAALSVSFGGYVARHQGRHAASIRASGAALATPGAHPAQRTFDLLQSARGYAWLGDVERARRLLDDAAARADDMTDPPPPIYWYSPPFFRLVVGVTLASLGQREDAAALVAEGKAGLPADQQGAEWVREFDEALKRADQSAGEGAP